MHTRITATTAPADTETGGGDQVTVHVGTDTNVIVYLHTPLDGSEPYVVVEVDTGDYPVRMYVDDEPVHDHEI